LVVGLALAARAVLLGLQTPPETATVQPVALLPTNEVTRGPTTTSTPAPTRTPMRTPTPPAIRLAVERSLFEAYASYFDALPARVEGTTIISYTRSSSADDVLAGELSDALLYWQSERPSAASILVREEPYAVAIHYGVMRHEVTREQLANLARGADQSLTFVSVGSDRLLAELLGVEDLGSNVVRESSWLRAKEAVATLANHIGLIPWEAVDYRVRILPVDGQTLQPADLTTYPLVRRMWLDVKAPMPELLFADLRAALGYEPEPSITLAAVGDLMLAESVGESIAATSPRYPFEGEGVRPILAGADIAVGNLECAVAEGGERQAKPYTFLADPAVIEGLQYAGLDVLSMANNHTGDYGDSAMVETLDALDAAELIAVGAGRTITDAHASKIVTANGLRVAFLAYNQIAPESFAATETSPGSAWADPAAMAADVQAARDAADLVVVICHWGAEYATHTNASQRALASALAEAGADLVIGHHPHVLQGFGFFADTFVAYSLGNFVFYPMFDANTAETIILRCVLDSTGVKTVEWLPMVIESGQPRLTSPGTATEIREQLLKVTQDQGALPSPLS
ncbi:MAG: CapA family protein, partial [Chloroflexi bacterium]|nr:CapA family protein [Chloroflexota bacterium]